MAVTDKSPADDLQRLIFDLQPTPLVVLSDAHTIVLINQACRALLPSEGHSLIGLHVSALPLLWQDGPTQTLLELLTNPDTRDFESNHNTDSRTSDALQLRVDLFRDQESTVVSACLLVTGLVIAGRPYQLLSFENVKENHEAYVVTNDAKGTYPPIVSSTSSPPSRDHAYAGAKNLSSTTQENLLGKFAQLRDAIYYNQRERSGFLLSADERFCYPNYDGFGDVVPVEIDDFDLFFRNWDLWDADFTRSLPISEYPTVYLNRSREIFQKKRYGLKERGKRFVIEATGELLYDHRSGQYIGCVAWIVIVGEYEDVLAQDLANDLADFRTMCDRLPHLLWTVNAAGQADYFSQSWYDFTGLSEAQSLGLAFEQAVVAEDMQRIWASFAIAAAKKVDCLAEARYHRHDGKLVWMQVRAKPLFDSNGNILKWYGSSTDIDSIMIERLTAEEQRIQIMGMLSLADVGLFEIDKDQRLTTLEGKVLWQDELQWNEISAGLDSLDGGGASLFENHLRETLSGQRDAAVFEEPIGNRWYKFRLVANQECDKDKNMQRKVLGCSVDITEQKMRAALESENSRLIHEASFETEKSRLKTAFLAHMSHEIRTPIAGIIGTANILAESYPDEEFRDGINDIEMLGNNLLTIINDVLDFSKIEAGKMDLENIVYDMNSVIGQVTKVFRYVTRGKQIQITCLQDVSTPLYLTGDPGRVKQILINLVSNAAKFTHEGTIELEATVKQHEVQILVRDSGEGIDEQTMATLFRPFVQGDASTARRHGGTGLGLTISRDLAEKMGGSLMLSSVFSKGTVATLTLPRRIIADDIPFQNLNVSKGRPDAVAQQITATTTPEKELSPSNVFVLVAEDNAINQKVALNLVRKLGYRAEAVWNGQEVLDYIETKQIPSLILMDCQMPLLDGYHATKLLRQDPKYVKARSVPVIALTASAIQGDREKCHAAGMDAYLCKPVNKQLLQTVLEKFSSSVEGEDAQ